jgi:nucleotide-binding universal stress UspA family protein
MVVMETGFALQRIVVALDSSSHSRAAFEAAALLAQRLDAELEGLFIEDIDLVKLAALPFGNEVSLATGEARPFDGGALEEQLAREVSRARRLVEGKAGKTRLRTRFRVARGRIETEIIAASSNADLLIVGAAGLDIGFGMRFRPGRVALAAAEQAPGSVLLLRSGSTFRGSPLVPFDGSPGSERALTAALRLARINDRGVQILITEDDTEKSAALHARASGQASAQGVGLTENIAPGVTISGMCRIVQQTDADILVLSGDDARLEGNGRKTLLERVACPVLLVR